MRTSRFVTSAPMEFKFWVQKLTQHVSVPRPGPRGEACTSWSSLFLVFIESLKRMMCFLKRFGENTQKIHKYIPTMQQQYNNTTINDLKTKS